MSSLALVAADPLGRFPTHYEFLGISADERDPGVIEEAALRRANQVRAYQLTCEHECTRLLGIIAEALLTLLDPARRHAYDRGLDQAAGPPAPGGPPGRLPQSLALAPVPGDRRPSPACDVELVLREGARGHGGRFRTRQLAAARAECGPQPLLISFSCPGR